MILVLQECLKKTQSEMPQAVDGVIKTLQTSTIYRDELFAFVDEAYRNKSLKRIDKTNTTAVGFFDRKITDFLRTKGIDASVRNVMCLSKV